MWTEESFSFTSCERLGVWGFVYMGKRVRIVLEAEGDNIRKELICG